MKYHVFSVIGSGHGAAEWGMQPTEWIAFYEELERVAPAHHTRVWYQPTYARRDRIAGYAADGYRGCIGRTLDRISIFPDGQAYVCSFLFDTDLHFANMIDGQIVVNKNDNEFDLFTRVLTQAAAASARSQAPAWAAAPQKNLSWGRLPAPASPTSCQSADSGKPTSAPRPLP